MIIQNQVLLFNKNVFLPKRLIYARENQFSPLQLAPAPMLLLLQAQQLLFPHMTAPIRWAIHRPHCLCRMSAVKLLLLATDCGA
jgi:hypothetical protein